MSEFFLTRLTQLMDVEENVDFVEEFKGVIGVPDYLVYRKRKDNIVYTVSFELKLHDWRKGLKQAFKYKSFTNESYLVLDEIRYASSRIDLELFRKANIGLICFSKNQVVTSIYRPSPNLPYSKTNGKRVVGALRTRGVEAAGRGAFNRSTQNQFILL